MSDLEALKLEVRAAWSEVHAQAAEVRRLTRERDDLANAARLLLDVLDSREEIDAETEVAALRLLAAVTRDEKGDDHEPEV